jgi:competence protein ComEA
MDTPSPTAPPAVATSSPPQPVTLTFDGTNWVAPPTLAPSSSPQPPTVAPSSSPQPPSVVTAWPRSAQLTTAFLLGVAASLLTVQVLGSVRWGARPAELQRDTVALYRIDLNRASRAELLQVPGLGPALVERILDYRDQHEGFRRIDDLLQIRGIGPATLQRVRPWLTVATEDEQPIPPAVVRRSSYPAEPATGDSMGNEPRRTTGKKETNLAAPIDINRASAQELQKLSGVGPVLSQRIIDERNKRPFKTVDELRRVSGIGAKTLEKLRPNVTVSPVPSSLATAE